MFDTNAKVSIIHLAVIASFFFFLCVEIEIINSSFSLRKIQSAQLVEYMHHKWFFFFFCSMMMLLAWVQYLVIRYRS